jgi:hypothetical protein
VPVFQEEIDEAAVLVSGVEGAERQGLDELEGEGGREGGKGRGGGEK